jgi:hypothetical protein
MLGTQAQQTILAQGYLWDQPKASFAQKASASELETIATAGLAS